MFVITFSPFVVLYQCSIPQFKPLYCVAGLECGQCDLGGGVGVRGGGASSVVNAVHQGYSPDRSLS